MPRSGEHEFLTQVLKNDRAAIAMCEQLFRISQVLDDLVDRDKPVADQQIIRAFWEALIALPANPFYRQHELSIRPLLAAALQDWTDSVALERAGDDHGRHLAFVLRDQLTGVVIQCAGFVGGYDWMQQASQLIRRHFHEDSLADYLSEFNEQEEHTA